MEVEREVSLIPTVSTSCKGWQEGFKTLVNEGGELLIVGNHGYLSSLERAINSGSLIETLRLVLLGGSEALAYPGVNSENLSRLLRAPLFSKRPELINRVVSLLVSGALLGFGVAGAVATIVELLKREVEVATVSLNGGSGLILRLLK